MRTSQPVREQGTEFLRMRAGSGEVLRDNRASGGRRVVNREGAGRRWVPRAALRRRARIVVLSTLVALAVCLVTTAASASTFTAQGSAKQVYVTGLAPNAQTELLN